MNIHETERTFQNIPKSTGITNFKLLFLCYHVDTIYVWNTPGQQYYICIEYSGAEISSTISRDYKYVLTCKGREELDLNIEYKLCAKC